MLRTTGNTVSPANRRVEARSNFASFEWTESGNESEDEFDELDLTLDIALCQPSNLSFTDHVDCFIPLDCPFGADERAEAEARIYASFDRTVILLDNIVEMR